MINSIKELNFDEKMSELIKNVEDTFNVFAEIEDTKETMIDWINDNLDAILDESVINNLTNREKFLFAFGVLMMSLQERLNS